MSTRQPRAARPSHPPRRSSSTSNIADDSRPQSPRRLCSAFAPEAHAHIWVRVKSLISPVSAKPKRALFEILGRLRRRSCPFLEKKEEARQARRGRKQTRSMLTGKECTVRSTKGRLPWIALVMSELTVESSLCLQYS